MLKEFNNFRDSTFLVAWTLKYLIIQKMKKYMMVAVIFRYTFKMIAASNCRCRRSFWCRCNIWRWIPSTFKFDYTIGTVKILFHFKKVNQLIPRKEITFLDDVAMGYFYCVTLSSDCIWKRGYLGILCRNECTLMK